MNSFEQASGCPAHLVTLPLVDAQELATVEWEELENELEDDLPEQTPLGPDTLEGLELFGAMIHVDPGAKEIRCA